MTFTSVDRIVYSTCSLHEQENELVVREALHGNPTWQLCAPYCLRQWKRRGHEVEGLTTEQSKCLIRADRGDETNGFFVAYFERRDKAPFRNGTTNASGNVVVPKGLSSYLGEFSIKCGDGPVEGTVQHRSQVHAAKSVVSTRTADAKSKTVVSTPKKVAVEIKDPIRKVVAKKQAKKLAWKQQQIKQKKERLLMKEKSNALV
ncbi:Pfam Nol1 Nop2 Fmu [Fragilaria crotonensis]|nr:Pfam Nol1 Nop2 Fmu [Fragilaria crotonensis]